jgi:hypothetical protein
MNELHKGSRVLTNEGEDNIKRKRVDGIQHEQCDHGSPWYRGGCRVAFR